MSLQENLGNTIPGFGAVPPAPEGSPAVAPKPKAKKADKPKPKAKAKGTVKKTTVAAPTKAAGKAKAAPKAPKKPRTTKPDDGARLVAKASGDQLNSSQVRMLRALAECRNQTGITRAELKVGCGIREDQKYTSDWLNSLWAMEGKKLIAILEPLEGERAQRHLILAKGRDILKTAERIAKKLKD